MNGPPGYPPAYPNAPAWGPPVPPRRPRWGLVGNNLGVMQFAQIEGYLG
jgi:hypothetical protein